MQAIRLFFGPLLFLIMTFAAMLVVSGCAKIEEPWMGADAETKKQWLSAQSRVSERHSHPDAEVDQLGHRLLLSQTDH